MYPSFKCPHCGAIRPLEDQESNTRLFTCPDCGEDVDVTIPIGQLAHRRHIYFYVASIVCAPLVFYFISVIPGAISVGQQFKQPWIWMWIEVTGGLWIPAAVFVLVSFRYMPKERIKLVLLIIYS